MESSPAAAGAASPRGGKGKGRGKGKSKAAPEPERALPLERGHFFVLFRPKVDAEEVHSLGEVQKMYLWLSPEKVRMADHVTHPLGSGASGEGTAAAAAEGGGGGGSPQQRKHKLEEAGEGETAAAAAAGGAQESASPRKSKRVKTAPVKADEAEQKVSTVRVPHIQPGRPLHPDAKKVPAKHRLLLVPTKRFPTTNVRAPHWAFVEEVGDSVDAIKKHIGEFHYHTATRGDRTNAAARIIAEGVYEICKEEKHTYLFYELEFPHDITEVQHAFNIQKEGVILIQVKNPHSSNANRYGDVVAGLSSKAKPEYPAELQEHFKGIRVKETKFASLEPGMLNYKGTELLLLGVKAAPKALLGAEEVEWLEKVADLEARQAPSEKDEEKVLEKMTGVGGEEIALEHW